LSFAPYGWSGSDPPLSESVAAVIEVKSNISRQWSEASATANKLSAIQKNYTASFSIGGSGQSGMSFMAFGGSSRSRIPFFVVSYNGWQSLDVLKNHLINNTNIDGILVINPGFYVSKNMEAGGMWSLWGLICDLHSAVTALQNATCNPAIYA